MEIVLDVELGVILFHIMYRFREAVNQVESVVEVAVPYQVGTGVASWMGVVCMWGCVGCLGVGVGVRACACVRARAHLPMTNLNSVENGV